MPIIWLKKPQKYPVTGKSLKFKGKKCWHRFILKEHVKRCSQASLLSNRESSDLLLQRIKRSQCLFSPTMHLSWLGEPRGTVVAPPCWMLARAVSCLCKNVELRSHDCVCTGFFSTHLLVCYSLLIKNLLVCIFLSSVCFSLKHHHLLVQIIP